MPYKYSGRVIKEGRAWIDNDGIQHPGNWATAWTDEDKADRGLVFEAPPMPYDNRFYWGYDANGYLIHRNLEDKPNVDENDEPVLDENGVQTVTLGLKSTHIAKIKEQAKSQLTSTEWYFTREADNGTPVPLNVKAYRAAVRATSNTMEAAITACADLGEFIALFESTEESPSVLSAWPDENDTFSSYVPDQVTMRQARLALLGAGLLDDVESNITDPAIRIEWDYAQVVRRNDPLVDSIKSSLGLTKKKVDGLFKTAATL